MVGKLIREGSSEVKMDCEKLLARESIQKPINEQIVFSQFGANDNALWKHDAILLELKTRDTREQDLEETVKRALEQIEEKEYAKELLERGFTEGQIRKYGFAFDGKQVLIG